MSADAWRLHDIDQRMRAIGEQLRAETDEERADALIAIRAELARDLAGCVETCGLLIDEAERAAGVLDDCAREYRLRATAQQECATRLRGAVLQAMTAQQTAKVETRRVMVRVQMGPPALAYDDDFELDRISQDLVVTRQQVDVTAVRDLLLAGAPVPGCRLEQRPYLRLRLGG